jgi:FMN-dependent oxidoreductase (nitrilotriacetate monooxygenase family)
VPSHFVAPPRVSDDLLRVGLFWPTSRIQIPTEYLARRNPDVVNLDFQQRVAREVEAAGFDFVLVADGYTGVSDEGRRIGHLDPTTNAILWALPIFGATAHLGVITTMHPTFVEPAHAAAYGAALDSASGGRWAWNITSGFRDEEARLFGLDAMPSHDDRYTISEESIEIALRLWSGEHVTWEGEFHKVDGRLSGPPPVQKPYPTLVNAGASTRGKQFAGRLCDYVFASHPYFRHARELTAELDSYAAGYGRTGSARALFLCSSVLREDGDEARREMILIREEEERDGVFKKFMSVQSKGSESTAALIEQTAEAKKQSVLTETDLVGTPEEVADKLVGAYHEHGLRGVMVSLPVWWPEEIRRYRRMFDALRKAGVWVPAAERAELWLALFGESADRHDRKAATMAEKRKLHLLWFAGQGPGRWHKGYQPGVGYDWTQPEIYQDVARACERAKLDAILMPDGTHIKEPMDVALRSGHRLLVHDPIPTINFMAAVTKKIGFGTTQSANYWKPWPLARMLATIDHLTRGRIGWNIITQTAKIQAQNFGLDDIYPHDERYDRAAEFVEACMQLWEEGWDKDAVVADVENQRYARDGSARPISYEGRYIKVRGPLNVLPSPQGHPVLIQAGVSPRDMRFAAKWAEVVIAHKTSVADMKKYAEQVRAAVSDAGRDPYSVKIICSIKPVLGKTEAAAQEQWDFNMAHADIEAGLNTLTYLIGQDMTKYDLDKPIPWDEIEITNIASTKDTYHDNGANPTLREVALSEALDETFKIVGQA